MKALLAALALMLAAPASAGVLLLDYRNANDYSSTRNTADQTAMIATGLVRTQPPTDGYRAIPYTDSKTLWFRQGKSYTPSGTERTDHAVIHMSWKPGISVGADSMTRGSTTGGTKWPTVPQIFVGSCGVQFGKWTQTSTCSTGVASNLTYEARAANSNVFYSTKGPEVVRQGTNFRIVPTATRPDGIFRVLVGYAVSSASTGACTDCDATVRQTSSACDSMVVWVRMRSADDPAPLIFVDIGQSLGESSAWPLKWALAWADSVTGGRVLGSTVLETAVSVSGLCRSDNTSLQPDAEGAGPFVPLPYSVTRDSLNQIAGWDSLGSLGIPFSVTVDPDSARFFPFHRELAQRARKGKLTPQSWGGVAQNYTSGWNSNPIGRGGVGAMQIDAQTGRYRLNDVWGVSRTRNVGPAALPCAASDSSLRCLVEASFARTDSLASAWGMSGVDRIVWAPNMDWTPLGITRASAALLDSVAYHAYYGGARGFITTTEVQDINPASYKSPATQPLGYGYTGAIPVRSGVTTGPTSATLALIPSRADPSRPTDAISAVHNQVDEFASSWLTGMPWFLGYSGFTQPLGPGPVYHHEFYVVPKMLTISAQSLGGVGAANPKRHGFWFVKSLKSAIDMTNSFAGRQVLRIVYPEDLTR